MRKLIELTNQLSIVSAEIADLEELLLVGRISFIQSHGHSASKKDIDSYLNKTFSKYILKKELLDKANHYYLVRQNDELIGYSKTVFNRPHPKVLDSNIAKLERLYLLGDHHKKGTGAELLQFNIELAKLNNQKGMWLNVWVENKRAIRFYTRFGFRIFGSYDFRISAGHVNPNHQMYLRF